MWEGRLWKGKPGLERGQERDEFGTSSSVGVQAPNSAKRAVEDGKYSCVAK